MSMDSTREDMTQAVLEGVAFGLRDSLEVARSIGVNPERTKICGGGAKSPLWRKIIANVMNMKVDLIESEEGPGYGAAILAAVGCGVFDSVEEAAEKLVKVTGTEEPDPELVQKYEERYQEFKKLYPALKGFFKRNKYNLPERRSERRVRETGVEYIARLSFMSYNNNMSVPRQVICCTC